MQPSGGWLFSFIMISLGSVQVLSVSVVYSFYCCVVFHGMDISHVCLTVHPLKDIWVICSFYLLRLKLLWTFVSLYEYMYCMNISLQFLGRMPQSAIAGSYVNSLEVILFFFSFASLWCFYFLFWPV